MHLCACNICVRRTVYFVLGPGREVLKPLKFMDGTKGQGLPPLSHSPSPETPDEHLLSFRTGLINRETAMGQEGSPAPGRWGVLEIDLLRKDWINRWCSDSRTALNRKLERWLSGSEHWLLFYRIQIQFPACTLWLTAICNSDPKHQAHTCRYSQNTHAHKINVSSKTKIKQNPKQQGPKSHVGEHSEVLRVVSFFLFYLFFHLGRGGERAQTLCDGCEVNSQLSPVS